jgi:probable HAF family extracellular repeat protein
MKWLNRINASILLTTLVSPAALAAQTYNVSILLGNGGGAGANSINNRGWVAGQANNADNTISHAALWIGGSAPTDLGTLGSTELNSAVAWPVKNNGGIIVGISDTNQDNPLAPLNNSFSCWPFFAPGEPTGKVCKGFRWGKGLMTALAPFKGGYNSYATAANDHGQVVGWAETGFHDPTCDPNFQTLGFHAALWDTNGVIHDLPPLPGDSVSAATAINDKGHVVGISGECGIAVGGVSAKHAVLWENGVPRNIGDLGGHTWNTPTAINNNGVVVGFSLPADQEGTVNYRAFVWTKETGIKNLDEIPDVTIRSLALGINGNNQIVGRVSIAGVGRRAVIWQSPTASVQKLNDLAPGAPILTIAGDINNDGAIAGYTEGGFAFLAVPQ